MKLKLKDLIEFLKAVVALGAIALLWLVLTQVVAIAISAVVGIIVAIYADLIAGIVAGILTYAAVMKLIHFLEIFDMISSGRKERRKTETKKTVEPTEPNVSGS